MEKQVSRSPFSLLLLLALSLFAACARNCSEIPNSSFQVCLLALSASICRMYARLPYLPTCRMCARLPYLPTCRMCARANLLHVGALATIPRMRAEWLLA